MLDISGLSALAFPTDSQKSDKKPEEGGKMKPLLVLLSMFAPALAGAQFDFPAPGSGCDPIRPGCPADPHIVACDSCSASAMQAKALWAANREGENYVFVLDRDQRLVKHYWVYVTFSGTNIHKSVAPLGFSSPLDLSIKAALEATSDVHQWLKSDGNVTADDLTDAGINLPYENGFDFAAAVLSNGPINLSNAVSRYLNADFDETKSWAQALDQVAGGLINVIARIADLAVDANASITFEWNDGSNIKLKLEVFVDASGEIEVTATVLPVTLEAGNGDDIPFDLSGFGVDTSEGGTTDPIYLGNQGAYDDLWNYLNHLGSTGGASCSTTELRCDGNFCLAELDC